VCRHAHPEWDWNGSASDPALAGGVVLVALTDALGFGVFLGLGTWLLL
jgi:Mg/Co/Ni transporter MgtE